jgi:hypothetical protein
VLVVPLTQLIQTTPRSLRGPHAHQIEGCRDSGSAGTDQQAQAAKSGIWRLKEPSFLSVGAHLRHSGR